MTTKPTLYVIVNNHFDPTWRRCFDRRFTWNGSTYVSYADIEEYYLLDNLAIAHQHPEYKFEAESTLVVRKFVERHPEKLAELQALAQQGRFAVTGGGETIIDANLVHGESLVRNFLHGLLWVEETLNQKTCLAVRNDAFGNSAQLPQILRGVEINLATGFSYSPAQGRYWRGLDGSPILTESLPVVAHGGGATKYAPCPACQGAGCPQCHQRGFDDTDRASLPEAIDDDAIAAFTADLAALNASFVMVTPEELLPNPDLVEWAKSQISAYDVRFGFEEEALPYLGDWLAELDNPPAGQIHSSVELNPNNSGVWVTRIKTKQTVRRQEYALMGAESLAVLAALKGHPYPRELIRRAWQNLHFTQFHDAITATHVDAAYAEIVDFWREIDADINRIQDEALFSLVTPRQAEVSVLNPSGEDATQICTAHIPENVLPAAPDGEIAPVLSIKPSCDGETVVTFLVANVPALGARSYALVPASPEGIVALKSPVIENGRFRIEADEHGILTLFDKSLGKCILESGQYRPGELIMEHDEGSPWATLHPDQSRTPLAPNTHLTAAEQGAGFQRLTFNVELPWGVCFASRGGVKGSLTVTLVDGLERADFSTRLNWATYNHRLRVAFPLTVHGRHLYGIPYGMLERQAYQPWFAWAAANGDWPAVNWAGVEGEEASIALLNKGIPSYRIEPGTHGGDLLLLSILRSPAVPTYLHEPEYYTMTGFDGMRDEGEHSFDYALTAYAGQFADSRVVADAEGYNIALLAVPGRAELPALPQVESANVRLSALKLAEKGDALILRLVEYRGRPGEVTLWLPSAFKNAARVNLLERQGQPLEWVGGSVKLTLRPWEIASVRLEY